MQLNVYQRAITWLYKRYVVIPYLKEVAEVLLDDEYEIVFAEPDEEFEDRTQH